MSVTEILQLADRLILKQEGRHLDEIEELIIKGTWENKTYQEISKECNLGESRVRNIGSKLWNILSESLATSINKDNFRSIFKRLKNIESYQNICNTGDNFHFSQILYNSTKQHQKNDNNTQSKSNNHDLTLAPQIITFHNRETELQTLTHWILNQNTHLISILGLSGIGKTTLVKRFIDLHQQKFDAIVWRSLKFPQSLDLLLDDLLKHHKLDSLPTINDKLKQLFDILTNKKCLIILDDLQNIFIPSQFAGKYQPEYQDYQTLFKMITETQHQSSVILISQEQCPEMECLDEELYPIKSLELSGLDNPEILKNTGLKNEDSWLKLIKLYEGNLLYLKSISILIHKNYDGQVVDFLGENTLHITNQMESHFQETFHHLSTQEQEIVLELSKFENPISREELRQSLNLSSVDFNNGLQSLQQRYLVTKIKEDKILFKLSPVFQEYVRTCC
ncbi:MULTISPECIES: ATP-binding protein [unclassified Dolichospermum]|uniref:ATP-binding protein n=1 Tax=unclassified Dolichospermum TaxID=2622029 RepID=UPI001445E5FA|nr:MULTISPECIES: ATP-binding protein [unclassified Dolichospermum]MTJ19088.1 ATP-binding protein [Dolichospermum sp. UHCC 0299]MTJ37942.1 ATP-binding protein [Dolichospermum sp. UHCC 0406]